MAFNKNEESKEFKYFVENSEVFDEKGNIYLTLDWSACYKSKDEVSEGDLKYSIVKHKINPDGTERILKILSCLTDNGQHELSNILLEQGCGDTKRGLISLAKRNDCPKEVSAAVYASYKNENPQNTEYVDLRKIIG